MYFLSLKVVVLSHHNLIMNDFDGYYYENLMQHKMIYLILELYLRLRNEICMFRRFL